jgi:predicted transposase/invertase (TIGR01784 family)
VYNKNGGLGRGRKFNEMNEELIVRPKLDVVFKALFVQNPNFLKNFLSEALCMPFDDFDKITITNPELLPEQYGEKFARLDLVIKKPDGTKFNVEMQNTDEHNYKERSVFNCSKMYTKDVKSGQDYMTIPKTVCINIVQFDLFENSDCICTVYPTIQETSEIVTEKWEIIYYQTTKIPQEKTGGIWDWLKLFTVETREALLEMKKAENVFVVEAVEAVKLMNEDDKMKEIARIRDENLFIEQTALYSSRQEGIKQGISQGISQGIKSEKFNIARTMINDGMDFEAVEKYTGIPSDTLRTLSP